MRSHDETCNVAVWADIPYSVSWMSFLKTYRIWKRQFLEYRDIIDSLMFCLFSKLPIQKKKSGKKLSSLRLLSMIESRKTKWTVVNHEDFCQWLLTNHRMNLKKQQYIQIFITSFNQISIMFTVTSSCQRTLKIASFSFESNSNFQCWNKTIIMIFTICW